MCGNMAAEGEDIEPRWIWLVGTSILGSIAESEPVGEALMLMPVISSIIFHYDKEF